MDIWDSHSKRNHILFHIFLWWARYFQLYFKVTKNRGLDYMDNDDYFSSVLGTLNTSLDLYMHRQWHHRSEIFIWKCVRITWICLTIIMCYHFLIIWNTPGLNWSTHFFIHSIDVTLGYAKWYISFDFVNPMIYCINNSDDEIMCYMMCWWWHFIVRF